MLLPCFLSVRYLNSHQINCNASHLQAFHNIHLLNILIKQGHSSHSKSWSNVIFSVPMGYCTTMIFSMILPTASLCLDVPRYNFSTPSAVSVSSFYIIHARIKKLKLMTIIILCSPFDICFP